MRGGEKADVFSGDRRPGPRGLCRARPAPRRRDGRKRSGRGIAARPKRWRRSCPPSRFAVPPIWPMCTLPKLRPPPAAAGPGGRRPSTSTTAAGPGSKPAVAALAQLPARERVWLAQEARALPGAEQWLLEQLPPAVRRPTGPSAHPTVRVTPWTRCLPAGRAPNGSSLPAFMPRSPAPGPEAEPSSSPRTKSCAGLRKNATYPWLPITASGARDHGRLSPTAAPPAPTAPRRPGRGGARRLRRILRRNRGLVPGLALPFRPVPAIS